MSLPAGEALAVIYTLADEWMWRRNVVTLLAGIAGADVNPDRLDDAIAATASRSRGGDRATQIVEFATAVGGEIVGPQDRRSLREGPA